jgi:hypothetical protein
MKNKQKAESRTIWWIMIIIVGALLTPQCGNQSTTTPIAELPTPAVSELVMNRSPNELLPGEEVKIWVNVTVVDPNISVVYTWNTTGGEIIRGQETRNITCKLPDTPGTYEVVLKVESGDWNTERSISIVVPTPTSTPTVTDTPTPTSTPIPTSTPTNTLTPTSTSTATPTQTPTPVDTPTPIPTPPQARVVAANGLESRSGPGADYGVIDTLPNGTPLDVLRRVVDKDDWIKVSVGPDSDDSIKGYVHIAPGSIKINVKLNDIPLMYEFGPKLYEPEPFADRPVDEMITFKWQDYGPLEEHQYYSIILVLDGLSDEHSCYHGQTKEPGVSFKPEDYGCIRGDYHWGVSIATNLACGRGEPNWRDDSERDERNPIGIGIPYSGGPKDKVTPTSIHGEPPGD